MAEPSIITLDAGTNGTRAMLVAKNGRVLAQAYRELTIRYPQPGWVEQNPLEIWEKSRAVLGEIFYFATSKGYRPEGIGISNQRETVVAWYRSSGKPLCPAVVWQCRRTARQCDHFRHQGVEKLLVERTGLPIDPYFSATKMAWILDTVDGGRQGAIKGDVLLGTVDSWLVWNLTGKNTHVTDASNASRTQLMNIHRLCWDSDLADLFQLPLESLPAIHPSAGEVGHTHNVDGLMDGIPILSLIGDSQAALFGETAFEPGMSKVTYGTGSSILTNTGSHSLPPAHGVASTVAWQIGEEATYALEGIIHATGASIEWLRSGLRLIESAKETESLASSVNDTGGVFFVPAFVGLGTPWWDTNARGLLIGVTLGTEREHVVRAVLDSIALQVHDVFLGIDALFPGNRERIFCGGGASRNRYLMQLQADLLQRPVITCSNPEASAMGAAFLAGLTAGIWTKQDVSAIHEGMVETTTLPQLSYGDLKPYVHQWHRAVKRSLEWAKGL